MSRPAIPAALKRQIEQEAGYRCAVPTCRDKGPFDFEHIIPWAEAKKHEFDNMLLLCVGCHARVTRKEIHKNAIRAYKRNLAVTNGRYSLYEMRLLEEFYKGIVVLTKRGTFSDETAHTLSWEISKTDRLHVKGLFNDGYLTFSTLVDESIEESLLQHTPFSVLLTDKGAKFIRSLFGGQDILEVKNDH